ncbi:MAG: D-alanyl-D-alanine carboxypeptidase/D-alanyl-D-alanine endopeptidase [Streptosporangiaceae bacterium]
MVITLAMMSVFTLAAGAAVATLMPARLARWNIPRVADRPAAAASQVLPGARSSAPLPTGHGLSAALSGILGSRVLGKQAGAEVADPGTGRVLFARGASTLIQPASTTKLVTAIAALDVLGPSARFTTRVVSGPSPGSIVLVGGGDPTLAAGPAPASDYPQPATLKALAAGTARALRAQGHRSVRMGYDASLFTGPPLAPGWPMSYITTGNVTAITSLEVDQGRLTLGGAPEDADDPGNFRPRSADPAAQAAQAFGAFLSSDGIRVTGPGGQHKPAAHASTIASVSSPPLSAIVGWMLRESNNVIAENLARQVALRDRRPASFSGAAAAVTATARRLGVARGIHLVDGSGLSPQDRIAPAALARLVSLASAGTRSRLRAAITGMPVAGFSGTLAPGQSVFSGFTARSLGLVRAKTGNLSSVATLAGLVYDASGRLLAFAFMTDQVPAAGLGKAADGLDRMASALAGCGCRSR